jgi:hypothetical protein
MFEGPDFEPTMWERAFGAMTEGLGRIFGRILNVIGAAVAAVSRAARVVGRDSRVVWRTVCVIGDPFWRSVFRKPLFLIAGIALIILGYRAVMHEPTDWLYGGEGGGKRGFLIVLVGGILLFLVFDRSKPQDN